jgi:periplasmic protein CpxP/Spy
MKQDHPIKERFMKTRILTIAGAALAAVIGASSGALVVAQEPPPGQPGMRRPGPGGPGLLGDIGLPLPMLNLSDEQKQQVKTVVDAHHDELRQLAGRIGPAHQALRQAMDTVPVDESLIRARTAELSAAEADGNVLRARVRAEILALLTPEQQQAVSQMRERRPGPRGPGGPEMRKQRQQGFKQRQQG